VLNPSEIDGFASILGLATRPTALAIRVTGVRDTWQWVHCWDACHLDRHSNVVMEKLKLVFFIITLVVFVYWSCTICLVTSKLFISCVCCFIYGSKTKPAFSLMCRSSEIRLRTLNCLMRVPAVIDNIRMMQCLNISLKLDSDQHYNRCNLSWIQTNAGHVSVVCFIPIRLNDAFNLLITAGHVLFHIMTAILAQDCTWLSLPTSIRAVWRLTVVFQISMRPFYREIGLSALGVVTAGRDQWLVTDQTECWSRGSGVCPHAGNLNNLENLNC